MNKLLDLFDSAVSAVDKAIRGGARRAWDGWLSSLLVVLVIVLTGLFILVDRIVERTDRVVAWIERALISLALLAMVVLTFNDFLARDYPKLAMDLRDGPNLSLVLMVWVGFLGASLATRQRKHLAVDASDRLLAPAAARFVKRFTALVAAILTWTLTKASWALVKESLEFEDTVEGLSVWRGMDTVLNTIISRLPGQPLPGTDWPLLEAGGAFPLWVAQVVLPISFFMITLRFGAIALLGKTDKPVLEDDEPAQAGIPTQEKPGNRTPRDVVLAGLLPGLLAGMAAAIALSSGWMIFLAAVLMVLVGAPLFVAIGTAAIASANMIGGYDTVAVITDMFEATKKHELLAIPFFVLAGNLMTQGSIANRLIDVARALLGRTPGGLGLASVLACTVFAAISGSSPVTVIAIGSIMYPMLIREQYPSSYSMGVLTTAGGLGIIIPPSVPMIVYAIVVSTPAAPIPPSELFLGGVLPGLFIAAVLMSYTVYRTRKVPLSQDLAGDTTWSAWGANLLKAMRRGILAMLLPLLILGGIYGFLTLEPFGIDLAIKLTVTEAAAIACVYALVVDLVFHRELKLRKLPSVLADSGVMMGSLFLILVLAISFNRFLTLEQIPQQAADWLVTQIDSKLAFIILVNIFLLLLGCVMDVLSAILIVAPLLAPIAARFGLHPVHFAIMFIVNLEIGYLTPPMGINLFVASTVFKRSVVDVIKGVIPFLFLMIFCLLVVAFFEPLSIALLPADAVTQHPAP